jgi:hypothetical protein
VTLCCVLLLLGVSRLQRIEKVVFFIVLQQFFIAGPKEILRVGLLARIPEFVLLQSPSKVLLIITPLNYSTVKYVVNGTDLALRMYIVRYIRTYRSIIRSILYLT